ncbi:MAG: hypothetical protein KJ659_06165 [Actinobacteria bacterium]|nr:hypothetical protein [Actinomycetota bacterium]MBU1609332.1 hypothetical protein [Actinomycetota bacterium]MBU2314964.1 hypothetical protein [Actinomycetota bacterium]MBU2385070.1 hypothetical protein [Actinomycetota bacterium]
MNRIRVSRWLALGVPVSGLLMVMASLVYLTPRADERFAPYRYGSDPGTNPLAPLEFAVSSIPFFLPLGNFRPGGRLIEHSNYFLIDIMIARLGMPMNAALGTIRVVSALMLLAALLFLVAMVARRSRLERSVKLGLLVVSGLSLAALMVAYGNSSALITFSGLYLQSSALVLLAVSAFLRCSIWYRAIPTLTEYVLYALLGAALAMFNEIVYLALPAIVAIYLVCAPWRGGALLRRWSKLAASRLLVTTLAGFALVFVPIRVAIGAICGSPDGDCYRASLINLSGWDVSFFLTRVQSGLPWPAWDSADWNPAASWGSGAFVALAVAVVFFALPPRSDDEAASSRQRGIHSEPAKNFAWVLFIALGAALVLSSAALSSLSDSLQQSQFSLGWRESVVSISGWALIVAGFYICMLTRDRLGLATRAVTSLVLAIGLALTANANLDRRPSELSNPLDIAGDRLSLEVASFAVSPDANRIRCQVEQLHADAYADLPAQHERIVSAVDSYVMGQFGAPFCDETEDAQS